MTEREQIMAAFEEALLKNMVSTPPEIQKIIDEHFFELAQISVQLPHPEEMEIATG